MIEQTDLSFDGQILIIANGLQILDNALPLAWLEKQRQSNVEIKLLILQEGLATGFGQVHPNLVLAARVCDEIIFGFGPSWARWKRDEGFEALQELLSRSSKISRFVGDLMWRQRLSRISSCLTLSGQHLTVIAYDLKNSLQDAFTRKLAGKSLLAISHSNTPFFLQSESEYYECRLDGSYFEKQLGEFDANKNVFVVIFDSTLGECQGNVRSAQAWIDRTDPKWLEFLAREFSHETGPLRATGQIGLLVSRPGIPNHPYAPSPGRRLDAIGQVRAAFEELSLEPTIMLHPNERYVASELHGWKLHSRVPNSLVLSSASVVVTFGAGLALDTYKAGKKAIEYLPASEALSESRYAKLGWTLQASDFGALKALIQAQLESKGNA